MALFLVPNLVVVSAVEFDMNKYFQMQWIAAALLAAWLIARWPRPVIVAVLAACAVSPALIAIHHATHPAVTMSLAQAAAGRWIEDNTPERAVFATDDFINSPVDLAGRLRITTFGPYVANLGYDPAPREAAIRPSTATDRRWRSRAWPNTGRRTCCRQAASSSATTACPRTSRRARCSRPSTRVDGVSVWRLAGELSDRGRPARRRPAGQPLGSTTMVTSGVMPVKTLMATL